MNDLLILLASVIALFVLVWAIRGNERPEGPSAGQDRILRVVGGLTVGAIVGGIVYWLLG